MKVTIVMRDSARVHRAGCADIRRHEMRQRGYLSSWDADVNSQQAAANDAWSDFIGESMTETDAMRYTTFLPCTKGLPASGEDDHAG